jgi:serine/threonine protein kinase
VAAEESGTRATEVSQLLAEAETRLAAGAYDQALRRANRVLALEPANAAAIQLIARSHARLRDALLSPERLQAQPPAPRDLVPAVPPALSDLILRCLARDRSQRFQSAGELHDALGALRRP